MGGAGPGRGADLTAPAAGLALDPHAPHHLVADFSPDAEALRACIDRHFSNPIQAGDGHQVWDYWHVPNLYTYLRTSPDKVIDRVLVDAFHARLQSFALRYLGMDHVTWPRLSLYVEGCGQALHNDSRNGAIGYVYSLTRWDERRFSGGETMIFREQDYWASGRFREAGAGRHFYETIPGPFNQLLLFDDRLIHGVAPVRGVADPREARLVLHGHISVGGMSIEGGLEQLMASDESGGAPEGLARMLGAVKAIVTAHKGLFHGFVTCAVQIDADGAVREVRPLVQRVLATTGPRVADPVVQQVLEAVRAVRFAPAPLPSRITLPVLFE